MQERLWGGRLSIVGFAKASKFPEESELARARPTRQIAPAGTSSASYVFIEPVDRALPGQIGRSFVIPFRRRVAIEAVSCAWINIAFVRNVGSAQRLVICRPRSCQPGVEFSVMDQDRRLNFGDVLWGGRTAIERRSCRQVGSQSHRQHICGR